MFGNQLEVAFKNAGYTESNKKRKKKNNKKRDIVCKKCGAPMKRYEGTNIAVCENEKCKGSSYFVMNHIN